MSMRAPNRMTSSNLAASAAVLGIALLFAQPGHALAENAPAQNSTSATQNIEGVNGTKTPVLEVPAKVQHKAARRPRLVARARRHPHIAGIVRPALAGVLLAEPVPGPFKSPQPPVIAPAYLFDSLAADFTTPPPPLVCGHRPRDPSLPDPHLYLEVPVACGYDIN
jgi:hypothetical protein